MYVYRIEDKNGKYYVGVTKDLKRRLKEHRKLKYELGRSIKEMGLDTFKISHFQVPTLEEAYEWEFLLVSPLDINQGRCYNSTYGGDPKKAFSLNNPMHSPDIMANFEGLFTTENNPMNDPALKRKMIESQNRRRIMIEGVMYESIRFAERFLGISRQCINYRLKSDNFKEYTYVD